MVMVKELAWRVLANLRAFAKGGLAASGAVIGA
jgi:hypothetical protein